MNNEFVVYNFPDFQVRKLKLDNYNDDIYCGFLFFTRNSLEVIREYFVIVGYCLINKKTGKIFPIDIMEDKIYIFEGPFNCMDKEIKDLLLIYNISTNPPYFTKFLFEWQFQCNFNCFEINEYYKLSSYIMGHNELLLKCKEKNLEFYFPSNFKELCNVVKNIIDLFDFDYMNVDFVESYKHLLYSLENEILIEFTKTDISIYFINFCNIILHCCCKEDNNEN